MKRLFALALAGIMTLSLVACGGSKKEETKEEAKAESVELKIHCDYTEDHPTAQLLAEFCEKVNADTNGTLTIKPYYAGALGDYTTVFDEVAQGSIDMTFGCTSVTYGQIFNLWNMPYLAPTWESAIEMFGPGSYMDTVTKELCDEIGMTMLGFHLVGAGGLAATKMPANWETFGADHEILIRVPNSDTQTIPLSDMGYNIQAINWSELFTAVQTGVVDGFVGGHPPAVYDQFRDVVKYYLQINNFFEVACIGINKATFESLSAEQQTALQEGAVWVFNESCVRGEEVENEYLQKLEDYGIEVIKPEAAVLEELAAQCREISWPKIKASFQNDEIFDGLVASLAE